MNQFQITSKPRHFRYIFFIDFDYPYEKLIKLIHHNQKLWGGRYNPIIPVKEGVIEQNYLEMIKHYDPDYIFYSNIGQLLMYVSYYDRIANLPHENPTIDILLCASKNNAVVKFTFPEEQKQIIASRYKLYLPATRETVIG